MTTSLGFGVESKRLSADAAEAGISRVPYRRDRQHQRGVADDRAERSLRELLALSKLFLILGCFAGSRPSGNNQGVITMISSTLLNLIVSMVAVGILVTVLRVGYQMAGARLEEAPDKAQVDTPYDVERAA
jgi:hypothetical protein